MRGRLAFALRRANDLLPERTSKDSAAFGASLPLNELPESRGVRQLAPQR